MTTEWEKMVSGQLYDATDPALVAQRLKARQLTRKFNDLDPSNPSGYAPIIRNLLAEVGENCWIEPRFTCDYGTNIYLGNNLYINFDCLILDSAPVRIGNNVMFGPAVHLYTATHPLKAAERVKGPELARPITIGHNVWVGGSAIICPGVTIGDNTTIGAGSVVTKDIPANVFAAGNPCRVIKTI